MFLDILKLDYFTNNKGANTPKWALREYNRNLLKERFEILTAEFVAENFAEYEGIAPKEIVKRLNFEEFEYDVLGNLERKRNIIIFDNKYNRRVRVCRDLKQ